MEGQKKDFQQALNFCYNCGSKMQPMFKFCPNCGHKALARVAVEPPSKVTPISPVAREAVADFETRLSELRIKKARKKYSSLPQKDPNVALLVGGGIALFALTYIVFHFFFIRISSLAK